MVLARMLAEATVLVSLVLLPGILFLTGHLAHTSITLKVVIFSLCVIAGLILPAYAFITWRVRVDQTGITTMSLAKKEHCPWAAIKRISRRSNWNWVRYVVEHEGGELSFPIWLIQVEELIDLIRDRLPKGSGVGNPFRKFSQDRISLLFQCMQAALGVGLVVTFWFFFGDLAHSQSTNQMDLTIVLGFCSILTVIFLWRTIVVFLMPRSIELTPSGIVIDTMLFNRRIGWQNVLKIGPSYPLLPEGYMLNTERGSFLIGNGMDSADELISSLRGKIESAHLIATTNGAKQNSGANQTDFKPDSSRSIIAESQSETKTTKSSESQNLASETDPAEKPDGMESEKLNLSVDEKENISPSNDKNTEKSKALPIGKKADRKFRKRKKNKPS